MEAMRARAMSIVFSEDRMRGDRVDDGQLLEDEITAALAAAHAEGVKEERERAAGHTGA